MIVLRAQNNNLFSPRNLCPASAGLFFLVRFADPPELPPFCPRLYAESVLVWPTGHRTPGAITSHFDPSATLAVHCGNGFDAGFDLYQSTHLSR